MSPTVGPILLTITAVIGMLAGYRNDRRYVYAACKILASAGFMWLGLAGGLPREIWGWLILTALGLSFMGDIALISRSKHAFTRGAALFFGAHTAFLIAFVLIGIDAVVLILALVPMSIIALVLRRTIHDCLPHQLIFVVGAYMMLLIVSVATGVASAWMVSSMALGIGILLVGTSDIAVLRERFIRAGFINKVAGLTAYYAGQLLIASVLLTR